MVKKVTIHFNTVGLAWTDNILKTPMKMKEHRSSVLLNRERVIFEPLFKTDSIVHLAVVS